MVTVPFQHVRRGSSVPPAPTGEDAVDERAASTSRSPHRAGRGTRRAPSISRYSWLLLAIVCLGLAGSATGAVASAGSTLSQDDACGMVLSRVLNVTTEERWVYVHPEPVPARTTVETWFGDVLLPEHEGWLFFVDDRPMTGWAHPCRYVHVALTGAVTVKDALGPPEDLEAWRRLAGALPKAASVAPVRRPATRAGRDALPPCTDPDHSYAVLISGGMNAYNHWERYYSDISFMYTTLVREYGYADDHIYVLMSDGTDPAPDQITYGRGYISSDPDLDGDGDGDVGYSATKANISAVFTHLGATLGAGDQLFIFATDHGGPDPAGTVPEDTILCLWGETISDDAFGAEVNRVSSAAPVMVTMEQCYSGGFIDDLVPGLPGQQRVVATAADAYSSSYADFFSKTWISAVAGYDMSGNAVDADANDDGTISMREAFAYADLNRYIGDTPQFGETPASVGTALALTPCYDPSLSAGFVASPTFGYTSLDVRFSDTSTGSPVAWEWAFGDGETSTAQHPSHTYTTIGSYTVTLAVRNATGHASAPVSQQITVADPAVLGEAVDAPTLAWSSSAGDCWVVDDAMTHDGEDAARSSVRHSGTSLLSTMVNGPATVSFWWKVSDPQYCRVYLYVNDTLAATTQRTTGWHRDEVPIPPGPHTLTWSYGKSFLAKQGEAGWLDQVAFGPPPALVAAFDAVPLSGTAPLAVRFSDTSTGFPVAWEWAFGDGGTSSEQHPSHTYTAAGSYTATLTVRNTTGHVSGPVSRRIAVADPAAIGEAVDAPALAWTMDPVLPWNFDPETTHDGEDAARSPATGDSASTNLSTVITGPATVSFWWKVSSEPGYDFLSLLVDGVEVTGISGDVDWVRYEHALAAGPHTVTWQYRKDYASTAGRDAGWVDQVAVLTAPTPFSAAFTAYPQSGPPPLSVQFLDYTRDARSWSWDFGDGGTSTGQNPVHVFNRSGFYSVSLTATDGNGRTATRTEFQLICVTDPVTPAPTAVANFSANTTSGPAPLAVQFTDGSGKAPFHWWWQFGDGASSTERDPVHTYERTGAYTVNLTVWTALGQATVSKPAHIIVDGDPRVPEANFTLSRTSGPAPLYVRFTDRSTGNPTSWRWDFGGLAWTSMKSPSVVFRTPGDYAVTLTVRNAHGWSSMGTNVTVTGPGPRSAKGDAVSIII